MATLQPIHNDPSEQNVNRNVSGGANTGNPIASHMFPQRSLMDYFFIIRERFFLGLALALLISVGFAYYKFKEVPVYESSSTLLIELAADQILDIEEVVEMSSRDEAEIENHRNQLLSKRLRDWVIGTITEKEKKAILEPYRSKEGELPSLDSLLKKGLSVSRARGQRMFRISYTHREPRITALLADRYATEYVKFILARTSVSNEAAAEFLSAQADQLRAQVEEGELKLQEYRQSRNLVSLEQSQNLVLDRLKSLDTALSQSRVKLITTESRNDRVTESLEQGVDPLSLPEITAYGSIAQLMTQLEELNTTKVQLSEVYLERHPKMLEIEASIAALQSRLDDNVERSISDLRNELKSVQLEVERLSESMQKAEQESLDLDKIAVDYNLLKRAVDNDQRMLDQVLARLNETNISSQLANTNFRILDLAFIPENPVSPNPKKVLLMSAFLFMVILCGVPIGLDMLNNKIKTAWDIESFLDKPIMGEIKEFKKSQIPTLASSVLKGADDHVTETYRALISQVNVASEVGFPKKMIVSSSLPSEGKSFVSSNLAATYAQHDYKTIIVDVDLRKPAQHRGFDLKNDSGIIRWLDKHVGQDKELLSLEPESLMKDEDLGIETLGDNLFLLKSGGNTRRPTERIKTDQFEALMNALAGQFDVIILDTPPVGLFPDAVFLSAFADEVLYVIKHNHVSKHKVKGVISNFQKTHTPVLGVVLNSIAKGKMRSGYYSYYGYGYGNSKYDYGKYGKYYAEDKA